ncbi:MAG: T9SS type A sorting domain-containing protein [Bacteroidales bacterium]|nr:T9SS type A sorting domain-containing protein [Bacteroidales bacterium]
MKKFILLQLLTVLLITATGQMAAAQDNAYLNYVTTDSAYVYRWDMTASHWVLNQVQYYSYTEGRLTSLITRNHETGADVALSEYVYDSSGRRESSTNYTWAGTWVPATRYLNEYDLLGRTSSIRLQKWVNGEWVEERLQQNYQYDAYNRLIGYETIYWRNNAWTLPTVNEQFYNELGKLESIVATRPGGAIDFRIIYEYNDKGLMTQFYTQYPAGGEWSNWNLRTIQYNKCGRKTGQTNYTGEGPDWNPSTMTEWFSSFNKDLYPGKEVPVCHKGHTLWVSPEALAAHLRRGDCLGECLYERETPRAKDRGLLFTIFPNPATEMITIRFSPDLCCEQMRVELTDFSGKLVKTYPVSDNSDLVIERGKLKSGYYNLSLIIGKESYSQTFIFE